jgi:hypothetical protein
MMSTCPRLDRGDVRGVLVAGAVLLCVIAWQSTANSQNFGTTQSFPGGVAIDAEGMLKNATVDELGKVRQQTLEALKQVPQELNGRLATRKVSLRRLDAEIRKCQEAGKPLPAEIVCLAGLQQIEYVLVLPEQKDLVLVGPGEGWKVDAKGNLVGATTGRPVMLLDDLVVALRAANNPQPAVFSCSIDPTPAGLQRLSIHARKLQTIGNPQQTAQGIEEQLGAQKITVTGLPETSHFASVMVAADYRMKRISMGIEAAPVTNLPSFVNLMKASGQGMRNMLPRWWLAPNYEPLLRDAEGLTWQLRGASVKTMAEEDLVDASGNRQHTGKADVVSQRWADAMTARYEDLAQVEPVFGQLRNCMDLAIVAAIVARERLVEKAQTSLPMLLDSSGIQTANLPAPKQVASKAVVVNKGKKWIIACGGVQINPWAIVEKSESKASLGDIRAKATLASDTAWWSN